MGRIIKRFSTLSVRARLFVLVGVFFVGLFIIGSVTVFLFKTSQTIAILVNEERIFSENFEAAIEHFYKYEILGNENELVLSKEHLQKTIAISGEFSKIDFTVKEMQEEDWMPFLYDIFKEGADFDKSKIKLMAKQISLFAKIKPEMLKDIQKVAFDASSLGQKVNAGIEDYAANKTPEKLANLQEQFASVHEYTDTFSSKLDQLSRYLFRTLYLLTALLAIILAAIVILISVKISDSIKRPVIKLVASLKEMVKGDLNSSFNIESTSEIGDVSRAYNEMQGRLQNIVSYAKNIAGGDYSTRLKPVSEKDQLTDVLNQMAAKLEETKISAEREIWLQNGMQKLDEEMRGNYSVKELSEQIIQYLSRFLQVEMGAVYVYDEVLQHLEFTGSAGINANEVKKTIQIGEGLIGNVAKKSDFQIIDTKEKYHKVFSAAGEIYPEKIYLISMFFNNRIQAVIELAPVNSLSDIKIEFLKLVKESISVNINAAMGRHRIKELLDRSLEQADVLKARDEELVQKLEENKLIHENLLRETTLLNSMLQTLPDYIYFKDMECRYLRISESMVSLYNAKSSKEVIGKTDFDYHPRKDAKRYFDEEQEIIKNGKGIIDEIRQGIDENGEEMWTSVTKLPIYDEEGKCIGTFGISKDVTNIKKLEVEVNSQNNKLIENQDKLKHTIEKMHVVQQELEREKIFMDALLNSSPDAIYFKDLESKFVKVSSSMPLLFNLEKPEDLYGKSDFDFFKKEHAMPAYNDEQKIINTKKPIIGKIEKDSFKDGSARYVSSTKMPLLDKKGNVIGTFGISRDITKIKKLEIEVNLQNEQLKQDQEELKATNEELHAQEEELRVANEELAEKTKILVENEKNLQVQQEELRVSNEELEAKTKLMELQKNEIIDKNKSLTITQNELKQKAKELELASQYKSEFLANMSHELRTPLNSMLILSKLLKDNKTKNLTEDQLKSISIIYNSGGDLLELINEILDLSKVEAGKMIFDFSEVVSEDIRNDIKINFSPVAENKNLKLNIQVSDNFPKSIFTDRQRLMQIIKNLLSNAFKFTSKGGITINMGTSKSNVNFVNPDLNPDNTFFIAVKDTGVGIPQSKVEAIFEAFQQADGSISRKFGGTGLGLSISKQLTRALGGEIHVKSEEGVGSVFTVYLPVDKELVGKEVSDNQSADVKNESISEKNAVEQKLQEPKKAVKVKQIPVFVDDDRDSALNRIMVLIIQNSAEKAKLLINLCHNKKINAVAAANIPDGIILAEMYSPQAIIISVDFSDSDELSKLTKSKFTAQIPIHIVSRIEDSLFDDIQELETPESKKLDSGSINIESKFNKEFRQVLVVEDDPVTRFAIQKLFENKDLIIHEAKTATQAYDMITIQPFDCVILDLGLPDYSGAELLDKLSAEKIPIPNVIIHTAKELSSKELRKLNTYSDSIVIKGVKSDERLMDEVSLFLHQVSNKLPKKYDSFSDGNYDKLGFKGKKVLIVDDDIRNVFAMAQILELQEIEILEAENGEVALDVLKNNPDIDLVLMDIMMPVMNGYEAMKIIRETPEIEHVPIITLTAKAMKEDYQKAIDSGANDFISKPVDVDKLLSLLKIWLFK